MQMVFDFPVNPRYDFDNFVVCHGNETAYRFARMLSRGEGRNILYIHGPAGSGKTHLLSALGKCLLSACSSGSIASGSTIPYISFRDIDFIYGGEYPAEQTSRLAERFRNSPALLIDDIHLIPDNINVRVELWQLLNDFFDSNRKIAVTGLFPPRELPALDEHLISRLLWGLVARMDVSDDDSRRLIMRKLAEDRQITLPAEVIDYLIIHTRRDIPSLSDALTAVNQYALSTGRRISLRLAREALALKG